MEQRNIETVGVVGCGRMGGAMARYLLEAGWPVVGVDPDEAALARVVAAGAQAASSAADAAARSDLVLIVVVDDAQVEAVVCGHDGALEGARPGTVLAVCSSVRPQTCRRLAGIATDRDVHLIDAALVGGERAAEAGRLTLMCGGPEEVVEACRPALTSFAGAVFVLGDVGSGQVAKAANNILMWAALRADFEAQRLARALGVEPARLRAALADGTGANRALAEWGRHRLRWPRKDLEVARTLAREAGVEMPLVDALGPLMEQLSVDDLHDLV